MLLNYISTLKLRQLLNGGLRCALINTCIGDCADEHLHTVHHKVCMQTNSWIEQRNREYYVVFFFYFSSIVNVIIYLNLWFGSIISLVSYVCMLHLIYTGCATKAAHEQQLQSSVTVQTASVHPHFCSAPTAQHKIMYMSEKKSTRKLLHGWCRQLFVCLPCYKW